MTQAANDSGPSPPHNSPQEGHYALTALQLLTRLPVQPLKGFEQAWVDRSTAYFPLAGLVVGVIVGAILLAAAAIWPAPVPALLAVVAGMAVTGALHEDGLADTVDGLGGGSTPEQRLGIMKDSRVGTYGALALIVAVALKVSALSMLAPIDAAVALILAHMSARVVPVLAAAYLPYVGDPATAKIPPLSSTPQRRWCAVILGLLPFVLIGGLMIVHKIRRFDLVIAFFVAALVSTGLTTTGISFAQEVSLAVIHTPLLFFAFVMLSEPMTTPPTRRPSSTAT